MESRDEATRIQNPQGPTGRERARGLELECSHTLVAGRGGTEVIRRRGLGAPLQPLTGPSRPRFSQQRLNSEDVPKIHVALSVSLFLLNLAFFINVGHGLKGSDAACWARGAVFHYFLLCAFTWMSLEAFHLYLLVIKVFNTYFGHYFLKLSLVGWGRCRLARQRGRLTLEEAARGPAWGKGGAAPSLIGSELEGWTAGGGFGGGRAKGAPAMPYLLLPLPPGLPALIVIGAGSANSYGPYAIRDEKNTATLEL